MREMPRVGRSDGGVGAVIAIVHLPYTSGAFQYKPESCCAVSWEGNRNDSNRVLSLKQPMGRLLQPSSLRPLTDQTFKINIS